MGRRRAPPRPQKAQMGTHLDLFTYALSRLPPRQLPILAAYAYIVTYICKKGWIDRTAAGKAGTALLGVLTMVTGLLLSYRFSSAVQKWDEGKSVWVGVRGTIRDGVRMLSIGRVDKPAQPRSEGSSVSDLEEVKAPSAHEKDSSDPSIISSPSKSSTTDKVQEKKRTVAEREDELTGLLVGFAFALQHHLHRTRALPQPPLIDILPPPYLTSLKRTEARVRFAEMHSGPSGSYFDVKTGEYRPRIQRRSTGPPTEDERQEAGLEEWDLGSLATTAEEALTKLTATAEDPELEQQLDQLNVQDSEELGKGKKAFGQAEGVNKGPGVGGKPKSNLAATQPANLPLALLKLLEAYVVGLSEVDKGEGGWSEAKRERALGVVKSLNGHLAEAERLSTNPPPLPLTLHLSHLLSIYLAALPVSLLCVVSGPYLVMITLLAGWCLLGLEALIAEVGGVFGHSENHHPLPRFANQILLESLDTNPSFWRSYRARLTSRVGEDDLEVIELDKRCRRSGEEWMPSFD